MFDDERKTASPSRSSHVGDFVEVVLDARFLQLSFALILTLE